MSYPTKRTEQKKKDGTVCWIKYPGPARQSIAVPLHKLIKPFLPRIFHPNYAPGGMTGLMNEVDRLKIFSDKGIPVPKVIEVHDNLIVLSDCGTSLHSTISKVNDIDHKEQLITKALKLLAQVHTKGLCHGRPHLKDFTINNSGQIFLLDLEENPLVVMSIEEAQARDLWLFLGSTNALSSGNLHLFLKLIDIYFSIGPTSVKQPARLITKRLRPIRKLIQFTRSQWLGRDVAGPYWATTALDAYFEQAG